MTNLEHIESRQRDLVKIAKAVLNSEVGIILGSRIIQSFRPELAADFDPDFMAFVAVDSDTDHLPVDEERNNWSAEALARKDIEIAEAESFIVTR
jgi:hypothetical protein